MDTLKAISELSTAIGFMQYEYNECHSEGLAANIQGLVEVREMVRKLHEALQQQRKYERENWPFVDENNQPTGTGASITYHLASLYCWSPGYVLTLPPEERDQRLQEVWRDFSIAGDIISRYEKATEALLKEQS